MKDYIPIGFIRDAAYKLGFDEIGASRLERLDISRFKDWISKGYSADMQWLKNYMEIRQDPSLLLEGSKSIIGFLASYNKQPIESNKNSGYKIASYAHYYDYHRSLKQALYKLIALIQESYPSFKAIPFVDSGPILEKEWAQRSSLGYIGRNSLLINPNHGSRVVISELIINYRTDYAENIHKDPCKDCNKCVLACPNSAINPDRTIDARLCNAYHSIENKSDIPKDIDLASYVFGCDICIDICPWNHKENNTSRLLELNPNINPLISSLNNHNLDRAIFNKAKKNSALSRIKFDKLLYNQSIVFNSL